jgi:mono/diheme cytochrome c family protein
MPLRLAFVLVAALALVGAGCGGGDEGGGAAETTVTETTATETTGGGTASGEMVFAQAGCGGCHTLAAAGSSGQVGPNLDDLDLTVDVVENQVRNGGGGMPAFEGDLSDAEIQAVAQYVVESSQGG